MKSKLIITLIAGLLASNLWGAAIQDAGVSALGRHTPITEYGSGPSTGTVSVSQIVYGDNGSNGLHSAIATPGMLHVSADGTLPSSLQNDFIFVSDATALTRGFTIFSCVAGPCAPTTTASVTVNVDGSASVGGTSPSSNVALYVTVAIGNDQLDNSIRVGGSESGGYLGNSVPLPSSSATGFFVTPAQTDTSFSFTNAIFTTSTVTVPVGVPVFTMLAMQLQLGLYASSGQTATGSGDFLHTVSFNRSGPVFNLPVGYTANSVDFGIVDNQFVTTPEPGSSAFLLLGAVWILSLRGLHRLSARRCRVARSRASPAGPRIHWAWGSRLRQPSSALPW